MGEENTFAGLGSKFFFCKQEDVGTDREEWYEAKLDNIQVRKFIEMPELDVQKLSKKRIDSPNSFSVSFEMAAESMQSFSHALKKTLKHQSGLRHYIHKTMSKSAKKALRKCHLHMKKYMFGRK